MKRALILAATIASISIPGVMASLVASRAVAEDTPLKQAIPGASPVEIVNIAADGRKSSAWDSTPKGILMFDGHHFSQTLVRSDLPNYASGDRMKGTPEENTATVHGMLTFFGTYDIGEDGALTYHIKGSSYPNFDGRSTKRHAEVSGDKLKISFAGSARGGSGYQVWQRLKYKP
jgi:Lipocalin-like domain